MADRERETPSSKDQATNPQRIAVGFGEGPVQTLPLWSELSADQQEAVKAFRLDPLHSKELDYRPVKTVEEQRAFDQVGRMRLKRMGRQTALRLAHMLKDDEVDKVVISGGRTMTKEQRDTLKEQYLRQYPVLAGLPDERLEPGFATYIRDVVNWPSEAGLMADVVMRRVGRTLFKRDYPEKRLVRLFAEEYVDHPPDTDLAQTYQQFKRDAYERYKENRLGGRVVVEDKATNTLENVALSINANPQLVEPGKEIRLVSANHHLDRIFLIAQQFGMPVTEADKRSTQQGLHEKATQIKHPYYRNLYQGMTEYMMDQGNNPWLQELVKGERRFVKGLTEPEYVTYWVGYPFELEDPHSIQTVINQFAGPEWQIAMVKAFASVGLDYTMFSQTNLAELAKNNPEGFRALRGQITELTQPDKRVIPPAEK